MSVGRARTTGSFFASGPFLVKDLLLGLREGRRAPDLATHVLAGFPPALSESAWSFRTSRAVMPNTARMTAAGLSMDMMAWPLRPRVALGRLLNRDIRVGRAPSNDLVIPHPDVSKLHAHFGVDGETVTLTDAGSANGTFINGARLGPGEMRPVHPRDTVGLGAVQLQLLRTEDFLALLRET